MNLCRLFSALSFAFVALPFLGAGCASTEEEPSPERTVVEEAVVDGDDVGLEPNICYMCWRCPRTGAQFCAWGGGGFTQCENNCAPTCEWVSTTLCS
jgi:hypothetical protein